MDTRQKIKERRLHRNSCLAILNYYCLNSKSSQIHSSDNLIDYPDKSKSKLCHVERYRSSNDTKSLPPGQLSSQKTGHFPKYTDPPKIKELQHKTNGKQQNADSDLNSNKWSERLPGIADLVEKYNRIKTNESPTVIEKSQHQPAGLQTMSSALSLPPMFDKSRVTKKSNKNNDPCNATCTSPDSLEETETRNRQRCEQKGILKSVNARNANAFSTLFSENRITKPKKSVTFPDEFPRYKQSKCTPNAPDRIHSRLLPILQPCNNHQIIMSRSKNTNQSHKMSGFFASNLLPHLYIPSNR